MSRLRTSDLEAVLDFLGEASSVEGPDPFPQTLLESLHRLVRSDEIYYSELDRVRRIALWSAGAPAEMEEPEEPTYWTSATSTRSVATTSRLVTSAP